MSKTVYLSASKLKRFRSCPHQSKFEKFVENPQVCFGDAFHSGIAEHFRGKSFQDGYQAKAIERKVPPTMQPKAVELFERLTHSEKFKYNNLAIEAGSILCIEDDEYDVVNYYGNKLLQQDFVEGVWGLTGKLDLVFINDKGELCIIDWKTGLSEELDDLQLATSALLAFKKWPGFGTINTAFYYVEKDQLVPVSWDSHSLVGALKHVDGLAVKYLTSLEKDQWERTPHKYCKNCQFFQTCEPAQKQLELRPDRDTWDLAPTKENFPQIVERLIKLESVQKSVDHVVEILKMRRNQVLKENGDKVQIDTMVWTGREKVQNYIYDVGGIFSATEQILGRAPFEIVEFCAGAFDLMVKNLSDKGTKTALNKIKGQFRTPKTKSYTVKPFIAQEAPDEEKEDGIPEEPETQTPPPTVTETQETKPAAGVWLVCVRCGFMTGPITDKTKAETCPSCQSPADQAWTFADSQDRAEAVQEKIVKRLEEKERLLKTLTDNSAGQKEGEA